MSPPPKSGCLACLKPARATGRLVERVRARAVWLPTAAQTKVKNSEGWLGSGQHRRATADASALLHREQFEKSHAAGTRLGPR